MVWPQPELKISHFSGLHVVPHKICRGAPIDTKFFVQVPDTMKCKIALCRLCHAKNRLMPVCFGRKCKRNCQFLASFVPEMCTDSSSDAQSEPVAAYGDIVDAVEGFLQGSPGTVRSTQATF